jgi:hypothetical protein
MASVIHPTVFSYQLSIKLNHDNSLLAILDIPHVRGHDLIGFLDGTRLPPSDSISLIDESLVVNPDYIAWTRQDQLLLSWLLSTISESVVA